MADFSLLVPRRSNQRADSEFGPALFLPFTDPRWNFVRKLFNGAKATVMAAAPAEETPAALSTEDEAPASESNHLDPEGEEKSHAEAETAEQDSHVDLKMEEVGAEAGNEKPLEATDKAASEAETTERSVADTEEETVANAAVAAAEEEEGQKPELDQNSGDTINEPGEYTAIKEAKEEPGEDSRCSVMDCDKSKTASEDSEKPSTGGAELGDKRRPSLEISSSDGEPLSRMDSEDRSVWIMTCYRCLELCGCKL